MFKPRECKKDCVYIQKIGAGECCGYIFKENHSRGCEPGPKCRRYRNEKSRPGKPRTSLPHKTWTSAVREPTPRKLTWNAKAGYQMYEEGYSDQEIADELGATKRSVQNVRLKYWGGAKPPGTRWNVHKGRELWRQGLGDEEIAKQVGTRKPNVERIRKKYWEKGQ